MYNGGAVVQSHVQWWCCSRVYLLRTVCRLVVCTYVCTDVFGMVSCYSTNGD